MVVVSLLLSLPILAVLLILRVLLLFLLLVFRASVTHGTNLLLWDRLGVPCLDRDRHFG